MLPPSYPNAARKKNNFLRQFDPIAIWAKKKGHTATVAVLAGAMALKKQQLIPNPVFWAAQ